MAAPSPKPFSIAIIGGGISGVVLAVALRRRAVPCTIYEQAAAFGEIGAGVGMHPNAVRAMRLCDPELIAAFEKVVTSNGWPSKRDVWFDVFDGTSDTAPKELRPLFTMKGGHSACHRARFLDEVVKLLPDDIARFHKRLRDVTEDAASGRLVLSFEDGSTAEADAVVGCDGIKSRTRGVVVGHDHPAARSAYSGKFAYRGLIPMEDAVRELGDEKARNASLWMGPGRHLLTFPVNHGGTLNLVGFVSREPWPSEEHMILPSTRDDALEDFKEFGPGVRRLISMTSQNSERWGLFDLAEHPLPTYHKGRICLVGDAAHASTPHHGAGAGMCVEDAAVLSALLADDLVRDARGLEAAFAAFEANRRERTQWLARSSREAADIYEWRSAVVRTRWGEDAQAEIERRQEFIWNIDLDEAVREARADLAKRLLG